MSPSGPTFPLVPRRPIRGLGLGTMRAGRRGPGSDVVGSRPYRPGDDVRRIDHRGSARLSSALARDEFIVREHLTEEVARVVLVIDRRPAMGLYPEELPWLHKPNVIREAATLIVDSAVQARCLVGYFDQGAGVRGAIPQSQDEPAWHPPDGQTKPWELTHRLLEEQSFLAPSDTIAQAFERLASSDRALPAGTFVFVLSDFLESPPEIVWSIALAREWDIVPVIISDPVWEQSFPAANGTVLPLTEPVTGQVSFVRLTKSEAEDRRRESERRHAATLDGFAAMGLDWVMLSDERQADILGEFLDWSEARQGAGRIAW